MTTESPKTPEEIAYEGEGGGEAIPRGRARARARRGTRDTRGAHEATLRRRLRRRVLAQEERQNPRRARQPAVPERRGAQGLVLADRPPGRPGEPPAPLGRRQAPVRARQAVAQEDVEEEEAPEPHARGRGGRRPLQSREEPLVLDDGDEAHDPQEDPRAARGGVQGHRREQVKGEVGLRVPRGRPPSVANREERVLVDVRHQGPQHQIQAKERVRGAADPEPGARRTDPETPDERRLGGADDLRRKQTF